MEVHMSEWELFYSKSHKFYGSSRRTIEQVILDEIQTCFDIMEADYAIQKQKAENIFSDAQAGTIQEME